MEIQKQHRAARLRLLVLLPITVTFTLALSLIIFSTDAFFNNQFEEKSKATSKLIEQGFKKQITHDIGYISGILLLIENNPEIKSAWLLQDRQQLIEASKKIYTNLNTTSNITHFYFHSPDGKNFLRVHRPGRFGDIIQRKTLLASRRTGELHAGLELGVFGQLVLRVVKPWIIDGKLVGYLELGQQVNHITQSLKEITNTDIITLIDKQLINKSTWQKILGSQFDWQKLNKHIVAASTLARIPDNLDLSAHDSLDPDSPITYKGEKTYISTRFTITDFSHANIGYMVVVQDISAEKNRLNNLLSNIAVIGGAIIIILFIGYFIYLGKIEDRLQRANRALYQKIGEHKKAENKLRINRDELASINRELESYSYSIAHDLRAPLRSVTSFSQIVLEDAKEKLNEDEKDNLQRVITASIRMAKLIDDILQLARITREELQTKPINLSMLVEHSRQQLASQEPERDIKWDIQQDVIVNADPRLMERAIDNLINNAWKYTGHSDNAKISFGTLTQHNETVYFVRDNGAGFDMNYAHKLFATFQRLHNPREFTGNGVGLAIVLRVIKRHHGRIWGEGEVGKGATFYFTLPDSEKT
jgi:signal transduction histidine kinase